LQENTRTETLAVSLVTRDPSTYDPKSTHGSQKPAQAQTPEAHCEELPCLVHGRFPWSHVPSVSNANLL